MCDEIESKATVIGERLVTLKGMQPGPAVFITRDTMLIYESIETEMDYYGSQFPISLDKKDIDAFIDLLKQAKLIMETIPNV